MDKKLLGWLKWLRQEFGVGKYHLRNLNKRRQVTTFGRHYCFWMFRKEILYTEYRSKGKGKQDSSDPGTSREKSTVVVEDKIE